MVVSEISTTLTSQDNALLVVAGRKRRSSLARRLPKHLLAECNFVHSIRQIFWRIGVIIKRLSSVCFLLLACFFSLRAPAVVNEAPANDNTYIDKINNDKA